MIHFATILTQILLRFWSWLKGILRRVEGGGVGGTPHPPKKNFHEKNKSLIFLWFSEKCKKNFFFWGGGPLPPGRGEEGVELNFRLQNFNPNDKLIYIIYLLTQFLNDQTVNYTFTLFWTVQQHIPNVQQHMLNVQQHIPNVQQHMLNVQQHIPMVQQHIWSTWE